MDRKLTEAVTELLQDEASLELRSEIMFAVADGKLPRVPVVGDKSGALFQGEPGVSQFVWQILSDST